MASQVDNLYFFLVALSAFFSILIASLVIIFAIRFRRRSPTEVGARITGSLPLELLWSVIPLLLALTVFAWSSFVYFQLRRPPNESMEIYATGKRWMWKFQHVNGVREINTLHVPLGKPVKFTMTSEDVIHSLYFPSMRTKYDVIPGRYTSQWFTPTKIGEYHIFCAEYCGTKHSGMIGTVYVMEPRDYQAWLAGGGSSATNQGPLSARGERLFADLACSSCHLPDGSGRGPSLAGVFGAPQKLTDGRTITVDHAYIRESLVTPQAKLVAGYGPLMPTFQGLVTEEQIVMLIEYIKALQPAAASGGGGAAQAGTQAAGQPTATK